LYNLDLQEAHLNINRSETALEFITESKRSKSIYTCWPRGCPYKRAKKDASYDGENPS
jgi:hypothetical protein